MHRLAESIVSCGHAATIIQDSSDFHPGWFVSTVSTISHSNWIALRDNQSFSVSDVLIFPETFIGNFRDYARGLSSVIFNQNSSYTFGLPGSGSFYDPLKVISLYNDPIVKHVMCVSKYDANFISNYIRTSPGDVSCIVNGLEDSLAKPLDIKKKRIVYMPRKNFLDASIVTSLISQSEIFNDWTIVQLNNKSHSDVITTLRSSLLFLSFGHPEGFGLPVAEALACGCAVVGYSGLGGRELFDIGNRYSVANEVAFGDWVGFLKSFERIDHLLNSKPEAFLAQLLATSKAVLHKYSISSMHSSVSSAISLIEKSLL